MKKIVFLLMALFTISSMKAADYAITFSNDETKGTAVANPERATPGELVTITVTPKRGYAVKDVTVEAGYEIQGGSGGARAPKKIGAKKIRQSQGTVEVTKNSDTEFTFTPPTTLSGISFTYNDNTNFLVTITYEEVAILYPIVAADADTIQGCSSVTVTPTEQEIGKDVEITVVPDNHYEVDRVWVTAISEAEDGEAPEEADTKARKSPKKANLHIDYDVEIEATAVEGKENTYSFTLPETLSGGPLADDYNDGTKFIVHVKMNEIPTVILANASEANTDTIVKYKGQVVNVKLEDRTIKSGTWNTICVPFPLTLKGSILEGADVRQLVSSQLVGNTVRLKFEKVDEMSASMPYIIQVDDDITEPVFNKVNIPDSENIEGGGSKNTDYATLVGTYKPQVWEDENRGVLFLASDGKFYYPDGKGTTRVNSQRAYVILENCVIKGTVTEETTTNPDDPEQGAGSDVKYFYFDIEETPTAIDTIDNGGIETDGTWYDITGRPVNGKPVARGIYINNGRKFIIK